jgi:tetrahydromethanopterin S-methyltransferase subunit G
MTEERIHDIELKVVALETRIESLAGAADHANRMDSLQERIDEVNKEVSEKIGEVQRRQDRWGGILLVIHPIVVGIAVIILSFLIKGNNGN